MACLQHWSVVDPRDTMRLRGVVALETEVVLAVFVYRVYSQLLAGWTALCKGDLMVSRGARHRELHMVGEITRDLCESTDPWEVGVGRRFRDYLKYVVDSMFERGLTRADAEARRLAAASVFWWHTGGRLDIDAFF